MKAKVLKYKFDGDTVVAPYMELEAYAENIYLSLSDKNEYGNENYDYFHVVCKVENIYFSCGQYSREMLGREEQKEKLVKYCKNWIANMLQDAENGNHVSLLSVSYTHLDVYKRQRQWSSWRNPTRIFSSTGATVTDTISVRKLSLIHI